MTLQLSCWFFFLRHVPGQKFWFGHHGWTECSRCGAKFRKRTDLPGPIY
jgi:hypothetical protein